MSQLHRRFDRDMIDLDDKTVLVTGGTGSFGQQFIRTVLQNFQMRRCIVFSRDEQKHYEMSQTFPVERYPCMRYFIGDVRDVDRLELAMRDVDYVVHAAAMKHVPLAEYNPFECVMTNIHGAENVVKAALRKGSNASSPCRPTRRPTRSIATVRPNSRPTRFSSPPTTWPAPVEPSFRWSATAM